MLPSRWTKALAISATCLGFAAAQPPNINGPVITLRTAGQPDRKVMVLKTERLPDGSVLNDVRDLATGLVYTITDQKPLTATHEVTSAEPLQTPLLPAAPPTPESNRPQIPKFGTNFPSHTAGKVAAEHAPPVGLPIPEPMLDRRPNLPSMLPDPRMLASVNPNQLPEPLADRTLKSTIQSTESITQRSKMGTVPATASYFPWRALATPSAPAQAAAALPMARPRSNDPLLVASAPRPSIPAMAMANPPPTKPVPTSSKIPTLFGRLFGSKETSKAPPQIMSASVGNGSRPASDSNNLNVIRPSVASASAPVRSTPATPPAQTPTQSLTPTPTSLAASRPKPAPATVAVRASSYFETGSLGERPAQPVSRNPAAVAPPAQRLVLLPQPSKPVVPEVSVASAPTSKPVVPEATLVPVPFEPPTPPSRVAAAPAASQAPVMPTIEPGAVEKFRIAPVGSSPQPTPAPAPHMEQTIAAQPEVKLPSVTVPNVSVPIAPLPEVAAAPTNVIPMDRIPAETVMAAPPAIAASNPVAALRMPNAVIPAEPVAVSPNLTIAESVVPVGSPASYDVELSPEEQMRRELEMPIKDLLHHVRPSFRMEMASALAEGRYGWRDEVKEVLLKVAQSDPVPVVRGHCISLLAKLGYTDPQFVAKLHNWATDVEPSIRRAAAEALSGAVAK